MLKPPVPFELPIAFFAVSGSTAVNVPGLCTTFSLACDMMFDSTKPPNAPSFPQVYFEKSYNYSHAVGTADNDGSVMFLSNRNSGTPHTMLRFAVRKRAVPSLTAYDPTQSNTAGMRDLDANTTYTNLAMNRAGETGCTAYPNVSIPMGRFIQFHFTADAEL